MAYANIRPSLSSSNICLAYLSANLPSPDSTSRQPDSSHLPLHGPLLRREPFNIHTNMREVVSTDATLRLFSNGLGQSIVIFRFVFND